MGRKGKNELVPPKEFRERTSLMLHSRSELTLKLDAAYDAFYFGQTQLKKEQLYGVLRDYRLAHGGYWNKCERNTVSGGLLEWLYNFTAPIPVLMGMGAKAHDARAAKKIDEFEIPHSRYGVLYLLGNIKIESDIIAVAIDGVGALGGAITSGITTNTAQLGSAAGSTRDITTLRGVQITGNTAIGAGQGVAAVGKTLTSQGGTVLAKPAPDVPTFPRTMAELTRISDALSDIYDHNKFYGVAAGFGTLVAAPVIGLSALGNLAMDVFDKIKTALKGVWRSIKAKMLANGAWTSEMLGAISKPALKFILNMVMKQAAPLVGGLIDVGTGLAKMFDAAGTRIAQWLDRRQITVQPGHPEEIVNGIEREMNFGIFKGLVDVLKGAGKLAVSAALPGLGFLVAACMTALEWLVKFVWRIAEAMAIDKFLVKAKAAWDIVKARAELQPGSAKGVRGEYKPKIDGTGILCDTEEFTKLFKEGCGASPLIPMLTLNSGICGSLMTMIKLFDDHGAQATSPGRAKSDFDIGGEMFTRLKYFSVKYMVNSGFQFQPRDVNDDAMRGFLTHTLKGHDRPTTLGGKITAVLTA